MRRRLSSGHEKILPDLSGNRDYAISMDVGLELQMLKSREISVKLSSCVVVSLVPMSLLLLLGNFALANMA